MELLKFEKDANRYRLYRFGIKLTLNLKYRYFQDIKKRFDKNKSFDCREFDNEIALKTDKLFKNYKFAEPLPTNPNRIAFLATQFCDMGGHTECVKRMTEVLSEKYEICTFLTNEALSFYQAPVKMSMIAKYSKILGVNQGESLRIKNGLLNLFNKINDYSPKVLFAWIHRDDIFGVSILYLLKKYTNIKIIYSNHASHYPVLGMSFSDAIGNSSESTFYVNKVYRGFDKNIYFNFIDEKKENVIDITDNEKAQVRKELGITDGNYFTLSGASPYKFFKNDLSDYFEMIKSLLEKEPKLQHVVITALERDKQKQIFNKIFDNSEEKSRLIFINYTPDYSKIFQSCDVFIDSFPIGSAMTHIDLMKHKKAAVVTKNDENSIYSFHEYYPSDYPYMFSNTKDMENGVLELLHDEKRRKEIEVLVYEHYLKTFECSKSAESYINAIENSDNLRKLFYKLDDNKKFNVRFD